jgi:hypothetical protein
VKRKWWWTVLRILVAPIYIVLLLLDMAAEISGDALHWWSNKLNTFTKWIHKTLP